MRSVYSYDVSLDGVGDGNQASGPSQLGAFDGRIAIFDAYDPAAFGPYYGYDGQSEGQPSISLGSFELPPSRAYWPASVPSFRGLGAAAASSAALAAAQAKQLNADAAVARAKEDLLAKGKALDAVIYKWVLEALRENGLTEEDAAAYIENRADVISGKIPLPTKYIGKQSLVEAVYYFDRWRNFQLQDVLSGKKTAASWLDMGKVVLSNVDAQKQALINSSPSMAAYKAAVASLDDAVRLARAAAALAEQASNAIREGAPAAFSILDFVSKHPYWIAGGALLLIGAPTAFAVWRSMRTAAKVASMATGVGDMDRMGRARYPHRRGLGYYEPEFALEGMGDIGTRDLPVGEMDYDERDGFPEYMEQAEAMLDGWKPRFSSGRSRSRRLVQRRKKSRKTSRR